jgi:hypothetical protein
MRKVDRLMISMLFSFTFVVIFVTGQEIKEEIRVANRTLLEELKK